MSNPNTPMTNEEYLLDDGAKCPFCHSFNLNAIGGIDADSGEAWQDIECLDCTETWQDVYKLVGYDKPDR